MVPVVGGGHVSAGAVLAKMARRAAVVEARLWSWSRQRPDGGGACSLERQQKRRWWRGCARAHELMVGGWNVCWAKVWQACRRTWQRFGGESVGACARGQTRDRPAAAVEGDGHGYCGQGGHSCGQAKVRGCCRAGAVGRYRRAFVVGRAAALRLCRIARHFMIHDGGRPAVSPRRMGLHARAAGNGRSRCSGGCAHRRSSAVLHGSPRMTPVRVRSARAMQEGARFRCPLKIV